MMYREGPHRRRDTLMERERERANRMALEMERREAERR